MQKTSLTVFIVDNSPFGRNLDFMPSRFQSGIAAAQLLGFAVFADSKQGEKSEVVLLSSAPPYLPVVVSSFEQFKEALSRVSVGDENSDLDTCLGVAKLLLMRSGASSRKSCFCLVGSPVEASLERRLSEFGADVDLLLYGDGLASRNQCVCKRPGVRLWEIPKTLGVFVFVFCALF
jgi:hypothetical protein